MRIPKVITKEDKVYIFVKEYPNFILYKDMLTGFKECFKVQDIVAVKNRRLDTKTSWERKEKNERL